MRQLQPQMNTVAMISDHRYISLRVRDEVHQAVNQHFPDLAFQSLSSPELTTGQLLDTLSGFDDKIGIIYYSWFVTQNRHEYLDDHVQRVIFGLAHTPIFTLTDRDHEEGSFAGGYYIPAISFSRVASATIREILGGKPGPRYSLERRRCSRCVSRLSPSRAPGSRSGPFPKGCRIQPGSSGFFPEVQVSSGYFRGLTFVAGCRYRDENALVRTAATAAEP